MKLRESSYKMGVKLAQELARGVVMAATLSGPAREKALAVIDDPKTADELYRKAVAKQEGKS